MSLDPELAQCLANTLSPDNGVRRNADRVLDTKKTQGGFAHSLLALIQDTAVPKPVRQSAALMFKNYVKQGWEEDECQFPVPADDKSALRHSIVPIMISLSDEHALQVQVGQAIQTIAEYDFPEQWPGLLDQLIANIHPDNYVINNSVLATAHAVFKPWRHKFRTDDLFRVINFVLATWCQPYFELLKRTDDLISSGQSFPAPKDPQTLLRSMLLLFQIFHDLNCQDVPEFFEDNLDPCMQILHKYLALPLPPSAASNSEDDDDEEAGEMEKIKACVCGIAELYTNQYIDDFKQMEQFVETVWRMLIGIGNQKKYDILVNKAIQFLSVAVKMPGKKAMFETADTLESLIEKIVLPNMTLRTFEEELFEDDPTEYIRRDLLGDASDTETRRQAAASFTRAMLQQFEARVTSIVEKYIGAYLQQYSSSPSTNWKSKNTAIFLLTSIAIRSSTTQHGVTSVNALVDVVQFLQQHILSDLQTPATNGAGASASTHPILRADAIKYIYTFRSQLTKEQLISVLPMLIPHLSDASPVIQTYAAITIERILFIKTNNQFIFSQADIRPFAESLISTCLNAIIRGGSTPEQLASNDAMMRCVMRTIITARQVMTPYFSTILTQLTNIITQISKNPSNPKFNHYCFESISALIRFVVAGSPNTLVEFENALFPPFQYILAQDVSEFSPFVFQILAQLLELHTDSLPTSYQALIQPILMANLWTQRGNVPALKRLVRALLSKGAEQFVAGNYVGSLRDIVRYLMPSKAHDPTSCELVEAMFQYLPPAALAPILNDLWVLMLTRLTQSRTDKFVGGFVKALFIALAIEKPGFEPDVIYDAVDKLQPGFFMKVLENIYPDLQKTPIKDRKTVTIGLSRLMTQSNRMLSESGIQAWPATMEVTLKLFLLPSALSTSNEIEEVTVADLEETGYQASYSQLGASQYTAPDPLPEIADPKQFLAKNLEACARAHPGQISALLGRVPQEYIQPFSQYLQSEGIVIS